MNKAVELSRVEAEKKVREVVTAKKKAREALERLTNLSSKEKIETKLLLYRLNVKGEKMNTTKCNQDNLHNICDAKENNKEKNFSPSNKSQAYQDFFLYWPDKVDEWRHIHSTRLRG
ncbi:hypothetical protein LguiA_018020 [Lonicera macranthoides]